MKKFASVLVIVLALFGGAGFFLARKLNYSPGNPFKKAQKIQKEQSQAANERDTALGVTPVFEPISPEEYNRLITTVPLPSTPKDTEKETAVKKVIKPEAYQSIIVAQGNSTPSRIYVGKLRDTVPGTWQLLNAFEYKLDEQNKQATIIQVDGQEVIIESRQVVAWTNLPANHRFVSAITDYLKSRP